ncbi:MAG: hypothetical protein H6566_28650 [Lewinellaceae bacterium]|nr:hypothetical protein [Lewinellaceae bacterium]
MKTTNFLAAFALAITLFACSEDPFFEVEPPLPLLLKEQLQSGPSSCPDCRPAPDGGLPPVLSKEQLQEQEGSDPWCPGCRPMPPGQEPPLWLLKEQLQGNEDFYSLPCVGCDP